MLSRSGSYYGLSKWRVEYGTFCYDSSALVVYVRRILDDAADLSFLCLACCLVSYVGVVDRKGSELHVSSTYTLRGDAVFPDYCFGWVASHFESTFASKPMFLSASLLSLT